LNNPAPITRRKSKRIYVGKVPVGDGAPIAVQSMTNTRTTNVEATVNQIKALERVGVDIVRVSVPTMHWVNTTDGRFVSQQKVDSSGFLSNPVVASDKLLIQAKGGEVYAFTR